MNRSALRILHVLDHSLPLHSGYTFRTAAILREQRALGWYTVQLTTPRQGPSQEPSEQADGLLFHRTCPRNGWLSRLPGGGYIAEMRATESRIEELVGMERPDILHAHSPVLNAIPALRVGRRLGIPVVYEVRALWEDAAVDHGTTSEGSLRYRATRVLESRALRSADHITTICEGLRKEISGRGIPSERITVIPNAVDADAFQQRGEPDHELAKRLGVAGSLTIGFIGSFYAYEGLDLLIESARLLADAHPDLRVLLVGGGPQQAELQALAARLGLGDRVVFVGRVPHSEVQRYYDLIDLLAYPRKKMRLTDIVTPLKPLEAMAQRRLFVASDVGGHRELVRDGETGFLFPAGDPQALARTISEVLAARSDWERVRAQARHYVESERTWARSVARYRTVYDGLLSARRVAA